MWTLIGSIVLEGMKIFSEERRTRIMDEYHELLELLRRAENAAPYVYTDSDIDLIDEKIEDFLTAYHKELKDHNNEIAS